MRGQIESGEDIAALRKFVGLSQEGFAAALGISVHKLDARRHCFYTTPILDRVGEDQ
jgi:hypothetical protein